MFGEQVPFGGIVALAQIALSGPIENKRQAVLYASCGDKAITHWIQYRQHGSGIDIADWLVANAWEGVLFQAADPLAAGSIATPFLFVLLDEFEGAPLERFGAFCCGTRGASSCPLGFERVFAARQHPPIFDCTFARFGQSNVLAGAHADVSSLAAAGVSKNPRASAPFADLQIGAVADSIATGVGKRGDGAGRK